MIGIFASTIIAATALYFAGFAIACFLTPRAVERFLQGFARSGPAHYSELGARFVIGASLISQAPMLLGSTVCRVIGWILVGTTFVLACIPWKWHRRIAERSVPRALQHLKLLGVAALTASVALFVALFAGRPP
jgi:hypothetical protein